jgi:amino acid adenylation domain-containing protein
LINEHFPEATCLFFRRGDKIYKKRQPLADAVLETFNGSGEQDRGYLVPECDDLPADRLFRFTLISLSSNCHLLGITLSHLVFDGGCHLRFFELLSRLYSSMVTGNGRLPTASAHLQERDGTYGRNQPSETSMSFWKDRLERNALGQHLTFLKPGACEYTRFITERRIIRGDEFHALRAFAAESGTTLFRVMAAASAVTVLKYAEEDDYPDGLALSHTVSARPHEDRLGCFTYVVPMGVPANSDWTLRECLTHIDKERDAVRDHQFIPLPLLMSMASGRHGHDRPVFNLLVNHSPGLLPSHPPALGELTAEWVKTPATGGPFDLGITFHWDDLALRISVDVPEERASRHLVAELANNLLEVLAWFPQQPDEKIGALEWSQPLTPVLSGPSHDLPADDALIARIMKGCQRTPGKIAVVDSQGAMTFGELERASKALACQIANAIDGPSLGKGIGLHVDRTRWLPVVMLAALLLEVPFVPLESSMPSEHLDAILASTGIGIVVGSGEAACKQLKQRHPSLCVLEVGHPPAMKAATTVSPLRIDRPSHLAYILFTSGSTGRPKGVQITKSNLLNFLLAMEVEPGLGNHDHFLAITPICFDISILELLGPLFTGGTVEIVGEDERRSANLLGKRLNESKATLIQGTPSTWRMLKNAGWRSPRSLTILCGGEALQPSIAKYLMDQGHLLYNMYGPTEATIWSSCARVLDGDQLFLGNPVQNTRYFIVDRAMRPVPTGKAGELVIQGEAIAAGYLDSGVNGNFMNIEGIKGPSYRTGDRVRSFGEGQIAFLGRFDHQCKVNGHRVELDEVSCRIRELAGIQDVFTVICHSPATHLRSYYHSNSGQVVDPEKVMEGLRLSLPAYMIPADLLRLSTIPLTPNGKVDTGRLAQAAPFLPQAPDPPSPCNHRDQASRTLREIQALALDQLGVHIQNPNMPLGRLGLNSISYNLLSQGLKAKLNVGIPPHRFYALGTLAAITSEVEALRKDPESSLAVVRSKSEARLPAPIAIIGFSVLMPQNLDADGLWDVLLKKRDLVTAQMRPGFQSPLHAAFLRQVDGFDAKFFNVSPLEANHMDPRQRLLLQEAWRAIEDAGYDPGELEGRRVGCYIGATGADYLTLQARSGSGMTPFTLPGGSSSLLANRLSSFFDWRGPSFTLDTACAGSLSALVKACQDLTHRICESAMVGGVNLITDDQISRGLEAGNFMSKRFQCAAFDESADGYVRGEGVGCFLLKTLSQAIESGDAIHGLILAHGENHGGHSSSLTAPNAGAQAALLIDTYQEDLASKVTYIETHGTGTPLGDPIEIDALKAAWKSLCGQANPQTIWLGAMKSNTGHLEPAAGVASLAKVLLAIRHGKLPPNNHFSRLNPAINLADSPFAILDRIQEWEPDGPRVAGISSFGFGGSNAHVVIGDPPVRTSDQTSDMPQIVTLSARSVPSLLQARTHLFAFLSDQLRQDRPVDFESLAFTLNVGRRHFEHRSAWVVRDLKDLLAQLAMSAEPRRQTGSPPAMGPRPQMDQTQYEELSRMKELYLNGQDVDWSHVYASQPNRRMHLPTYRFDTRTYWFDRQNRPAGIQG